MSKITETYPRNLPYKLSPEELRERSKNLAIALRDKTAIEATHKNRRDQMKEELSEIDARIGKIANVVYSGEDYQDVLVEVSMGDNETVQVKRLDSGEIIETRPARDEEKQLTLKLIEEEAVTPDPEVVKANAIHEKLATAEEKKTAPAKGKKKATPADLLATFKVHVPEKDSEKYSVTLGTVTVEDSLLKQAVMSAFKAYGIEASKPKALANMILKDYAPSEEREQILCCLEGMPIKDGEDK